MSKGRIIPRFGREWTNKEKDELRRMWRNEKYSIDEIAQKLDRSYGSVSDYARRKLGLSPRVNASHQKQGMEIDRDSPRWHQICIECNQAFDEEWERVMPENARY